MTSPHSGRTIPEPTGVGSCADFEDMLAGAALDALEPHEEMALRGHLVGCERCALELRTLRESAAALALTVPQEAPPPHVLERMRVLAKQDLPEMAPLQFAPRPADRRWASPARIVAAAGMAAAVASLVWAASLQAQVGALAQQAAASRDKAARFDRVVSVLQSTNLRTRPLEPVDPNMPAHGDVYLDSSSGTGMVMVRGLPALPPSRVWQVWFVRNGERASGGLLYGGQDGALYSIITVPRDLEDYDSIGITQEPEGGSLAPTSPKVIGTTL